MKKTLVPALVVTGIIWGGIELTYDRDSPIDEYVDAAGEPAVPTSSGDKSLGRGPAIPDPGEDPVESPSAPILSVDRDGLAPEASVVRVVSKNNAPVPGAEVFWIPAFPLADDRPHDLDPEQLLLHHASHQVITDEQGAAPHPDTLQPQESPLLVVARADGLAPDFAWLHSGDATTLRLARTAGVRGRVIDSTTGLPVPGVKIVSIPRARAGRAYVDHRSVMDRVLVGHGVSSDSRGEFSIPEMRDEVHFLFFSCDGFPKGTKIHIEPGDEVLIRLYPPGMVEGVVVDEDGTPIQGAEVFFGTRGVRPSTMMTAYTDEEGAFHFDAAPTGPTSIGAKKIGYAIEKKFFGEEGTPEYVEFELEPEVKLSGVVVDDLNRPIPGVELRVLDMSINADIGYMETEDDGSWYMYWMKDGTDVVLHCFKDGYSFIEHVGLRAPNEAIVTVMPRNGVVEGTVKDAAGNPIPKFWVEVVPATSRDQWEHSYRSNLEWVHYEDDDGRFRLIDIQSGFVELLIDAPGHAVFSLREQWVPPGDEGLDVEVTLPPTGSVSGRVVTAGGNPVSGVDLQVPLKSFSGEMTLSGARRVARTDSDGAFFLDGVSMPTFDVVVGGRGVGHRTFADLRPEDSPFELVLDEPGSLRGSVDVPWSGPDSVILIRLTPAEGGAVQEIYPTPHATFEFASLQPGQYLIEMVDEWLADERNSLYGSSAKWVTIHSGEVTVVELSGNQGSVHGHVRCDADRDLASCTVRAYAIEPDNEPTLRGQVSVDPAGYYCLLGLMPGEYDLLLTSNQPGTAISQTRRCKLEGSAPTVEVDFRVSASGLTATVIDPDGNPVDAQVLLIHAKSTAIELRTRTNQSGGYSFASPPEGQWHVWITAPTFAHAFHGPLDAPFRDLRVEHRLTHESRLQVDVQDDAATPLASARVELRPRSWPSTIPTPEKVTDAQGLTRFSRVPTGACRVAATLPGHAPAESEIALAVGSQRLVLVLERLGSLQVSVLNSGTMPVAGVVVHLTSSDAEFTPRTTATDRRGIAVFEELPSGHYQVTIEGQSKDVTVAPGARPEVELTVSE